MAKAKGSKAAWEVEFVQVNMLREDIELCKTWDKDYVQTLKILCECVFKLCKISMSYNATTSSFICTITVPSPVDGVQKRCFSSHAPDYMDAMKLAAYKVSEGLDGNPYNIFEAENNQEAWR